MKKENIHSTIHYYGTMLLAFCLPLERVLLPPIIGVLFLNWLIEGDFTSKLKRLRSQNELLFPIILYFLYGIGMLYSDNLDFGAHDLETKASLLLMPFIFGTSIALDKERILQILKVFIVGCITGILICIAHAIYMFYDEIAQVKAGLVHDLYIHFDFFFASRLSYFMHPSYFAMYLSLALVLLLMNVFGDRPKLFSSKLLAFLIGSLISFFIFFLASRLGIITMALSWLIAIVYLIVKRKYYLSGIMALAVMIFIFLFTYNNSKIIASRIDYLINALETKNIDKTSAESSSVRLLIWEQARVIIAEHPVVGVGTGDSKDALMEKYKAAGMTGAFGHNLNAHDQYYQTTIAIGLIGGIALLTLLFLPFLRSLRNNNYYMIFFLGLIILNFTVESMFETEAGVIFFSFFYALFITNIPFLSLNTNIKQ